MALSYANVRQAWVQTPFWIIIAIECWGIEGCDASSPEEINLPALHLKCPLEKKLEAYHRGNMPF